MVLQQVILKENAFLDNIVLMPEDIIVLKGIGVVNMDRYLHLFFDNIFNLKSTYFTQFRIFQPVLENVLQVIIVQKEVLHHMK